MFGFIPSLGVPELILILGLALVVFGPGKLPDVGKALGKTIKEFRGVVDSSKAEITEISKEIKDGVKDNEK